jgi:hypothetical protein
VGIDLTRRDYVTMLIGLRWSIALWSCWSRNELPTGRSAEQSLSAVKHRPPAEEAEKGSGHNGIEPEHEGLVGPNV